MRIIGRCGAVVLAGAGPPRLCHVFLHAIGDSRARGRRPTRMPTCRTPYASVSPRRRRRSPRSRTGERPRPSERLARLLTLPATSGRSTSAPAPGRSRSRLAPLVREVVGVDIVPELLEEARKRAPENVEFVEGDATSSRSRRIPSTSLSTARTLHHVPRPELVLAEMNRVLRPGRDDARRRPARPQRPARRDRAEPLRARARRLDDPHPCRRRPARALRLERPRPPAGRGLPGGARPRELPRPRGLPRRGARAARARSRRRTAPSTTAGTCSRSRSCFELDWSSVDLEGGLSRGTPSASNERITPMALINPSARAR